MAVLPLTAAVSAAALVASASAPTTGAAPSVASDGVRLTLLSARTDGTAANGASGGAALSPDGNWVAFWTEATDIAPPAEPETRRVLAVERATALVVDAHTSWDGEASDAGLFGYDAPGVGSAPPGEVPPLAFHSLWRDPDTLEDLQGVFLSRDGRTEQQDLDVDGLPAAGTSGLPALDGQANWLVFESFASSLVPWDENQARDVFARDLGFGVTYLVSATAEGVSGSGGSGSAHLSAAGGVVAFESDADDLVEEDSNGRRDVFVQELDSGWTERVSAPLYTDDGGSTVLWDAWYPSVASNGERAAFLAQQVTQPGHARPGVGVYAWQDDEDSGVVRLLSAPADGGTWRDSAAEPVISADGGWVAFTSSSRALDETKTDDEWDVFLADVGAMFRHEGPDAGTPPAPSLPAPALRRVSLPDLNGTRGLWIEITRYGLARGAAYAVISTARALVAADTNGVSDVYLVEWPNPGKLYLPALRAVARGQPPS